MSEFVTLTWAPEALTARLKAAVAPAAAAFKEVVQRAAPAKVIAESIFVAAGSGGATVGSRNPLGAFFEYGTSPHVIAPRSGNVLRLADGSFVTGPVRNPGMRARPFLRPALPLWPSLYRRAASAVIGGGLGRIF